MRFWVRMSVHKTMKFFFQFDPKCAVKIWGKSPEYLRIISWKFHVSKKNFFSLKFFDFENFQSAQTQRLAYSIVEWTMKNFMVHCQIGLFLVRSKVCCENLRREFWVPQDHFLKVSRKQKKFFLVWKFSTLKIFTV